MTTEKKRVHLIFGTQSPDAFPDLSTRARLREHLCEQCNLKDYKLEVIKVLADHVHLLIALTDGQDIAAIVKTLKGESSHWINQQQLTPLTFKWSQGQYTNLPVCEAEYKSVSKYIMEQEKIHQKISYEEEVNQLTYNYIFHRDN